MEETDTADLKAVFEPRSIAVIGASRRPQTIGHRILENLIRNRYTGAVYPVNPQARVIHSIHAYPSIADVPEPVDLAMIVVPKQHVLGVVEECGEAGVSAVVVITAGFREVGGAGVARENELLERVRKYGMRMVGPNCMGVLNTQPELSMNATFAPTTPPEGGVAMLSQSGAMGVTILDYAREYGIGISKFISMGNKADISGNDVLCYLRGDEYTSVILMYLENFGNPKRFMRVVHELTKTKPVIAVKSARTRAGARAAASHTGALASRDVATDALFAQAGVIRVDTIQELFDLAVGFGNAPLPQGNRVGIVTNAGGPGIIIADACESSGLKVPELAESTQKRLREALPAEAAVENPVDMIASAGADSYRQALETVLDDPGIDAVIASFVPPLGVQAEDVAAAITQTAVGRKEPTLAVLMGREGLPQSRALLNAARVPAYIFPESAVVALSAMDRYRRWLQRPQAKIIEFADVDREGAGAIIARSEAAGKQRLSEYDALALLEAYGVPIIASRPAGSPEEAVAAAKALGFPVVLKAMAPEVSHKTDLGGVILDIESELEVRGAFQQIVERLTASGVPAAGIEGVLVQPMVNEGRETIIGMAVDPTFGPLIMFGLGGIYVEALGDVAFRVQPVSDVDAGEMVRQVKGYRVLEGLRGEEGVDLEALREAILRISQLVGDFPSINELDINPFVSFPTGRLSMAMDARIVLASSRPGAG